MRFWSLYGELSGILDRRPRIKNAAGKSDSNLVEDNKRDRLLIFWTSDLEQAFMETKRQFADVTQKRHS